jgi:predicted esterase
MRIDDRVAATTSFSRRQFLRTVAGSSALSSALLAACGGDDSALTSGGGGNARLTARPGTPATLAAPGTYLITPTNENDGVLVVPPNIPANASAPLVIALHGAGMGSIYARTLLETPAKSRGFYLLAPGARGLTWDVMSYKFSYDVTFINSALAWTFNQCRVDPTRIIVQGFSDGASYALALSLANGDLFTRVVANSPGYVPGSDTPATGKPQYWFSHGTQDAILNIDSSSRAIVPKMRKQGYDVTYVEFDGGHELPATTLTQALDWALR